MNRDQPEIEWVPKGWGGEKVIVNKPEYCGKILYFIKNKRCSVHYHLKKRETFYLSSGKIRVFYTDDLEKYENWLKDLKNSNYTISLHYKDFLDSIVLNAGDTFDVPIKRVHQMVALRDSQLYEFSTQDFKDDSYKVIKGD
ncbi:MAG: cupin domain-containing protein [Asgard group archaeon]|nr:cupin domain-containing protein [Asgard group archaeon]